MLPAPSEKEKAVQKMFSSIASFYDLNNSLLSFGLHHRWKRQALQTARLRPGDRVADIGAGTADLSILAADAVGEKGGVAAVDLNEPMLRIGRRKLAGSGSGRAICTLGNAEALPLPDRSFDAVLTGFCMRNVSDLDLALREIVRILKPGGRIVCLEFSRPERPAFRRLYDFYSFTLLPKIGAWVSKDQTGVYQYLPDSIRKFPDQTALCRKLESVGLKEVCYHNVTAGIVAIHTGIKENKLKN